MKPSELILNPDGSVYHLGLKPGDCAPVIITVGDPNRVSTVAQYFDTIIFSHQTREIHTQTGMLSGRPISVISTGMGTDNIDIVLNELDALFNMDLQSGTPSPTHTQLTFIRLGTSGAIQSDVPTDSVIVAKTAIGFDNLLHYYDLPTHPMAKALTAYLSMPESISHPYGVDANSSLLSACNDLGFLKGTIATNSGFYGPQLRQLRLQPKKIYSFEQLIDFTFQNQSITHFDMESSGIYGLSQLMGHKAVSISAILANRSLGSFSSNPSATVDKMIRKVLDGITAGKFD
jgi:uridine phosphorylase